MVVTDRCTRLLEWFVSNGGAFNDDIELVEDEEYGIHARASTNLLGITKICFSPITVTLSHINVPGSNTQLAESLGVHVVHDTSLTSLVGKVDDQVLSYFLLIEQRSIGVRSFWHAYISCLPRDDEMTTPLYFTSEELKWILGTNLHASEEDPARSSVEIRRNQWKTQWKQGCDVLSSQDIDTTMYTWEMFLWAATIFTSRCFTSAVAINKDLEFPILYPVLDSLNHKFAAKVSWSFDDGSFTLSTEEAVLKGDQVYNNYAPKGNEELLLGYGFALNDNPCDEVVVRLGKPPDPVLAVLQADFPDHFTTPWDPIQGRFSLRISDLHGKPVNDQLPCLEGIPIQMYRMMAEMLYYMSTGDSGGVGHIEPDSKEFLDVVQGILSPLKQKLEMIELPAKELGREPMNRKEEMARLYRDGQIKILSQIVQTMETYSTREQ